MVSKFIWTDPTNGKANHIEVLYTDGGGDPDTQYGGNVNMGVQELAVANEETDLPAGRRFAARGVNTDTDPDTNGPLSNVYVVESDDVIVQEATDDYNATSSDSHYLSLPAPASEGNRLVVAFSGRSSSVTWDNIAGWTKYDFPVESATRVVIYVKDTLGGQDITATSSDNVRRVGWIGELQGLAASPVVTPTSNSVYRGSQVTLSGISPAAPAFLFFAASMSEAHTDLAFSNDVVLHLSNGTVPNEYPTYLIIGRREVPAGTYSTTLSWTNVDEFEGEPSHFDSSCVLACMPLLME